jgi:hypothetical protein
MKRMLWLVFHVAVSGFALRAEGDVDAVVIGFLQQQVDLCKDALVEGSGLDITHSSSALYAPPASSTTTSVSSYTSRPLMGTFTTQVVWNHTHDEVTSAYVSPSAAILTGQITNSQLLPAVSMPPDMRIGWAWTVSLIVSHVTISSKQGSHTWTLHSDGGSACLPQGF